MDMYIVNRLLEINKTFSPTLLIFGQTLTLHTITFKVSQRQVLYAYLSNYLESDVL